MSLCLLLFTHYSILELLQIIQQQKKEEGKLIFLIRRGNFYNAFNEGAFAFGRICHYRVRKKSMADGTVYYKLGFPPSSLGRVKDCMTQSGGSIVEQNDDASIIKIAGLDTSYDENLIDTDDPSLLMSRRKPRRLKGSKADVEQMIVDYDIGNSTPLEAMMFLNEIRMFLINRNKKKEEDDIPNTRQAVPHPDEGTVETAADGEAEK